ncbi:hypothetical protein Glove_54g137 [Diversispora epigaea]|uniref:Uncharacterized protein n=1 Tax=Diversispora epigaea TaxID=1348612 RepID=A0A397JF35_9GLOM|nr:hypothetical protein Glove_54g137 [Diversispora epigaea]
MRNPRRKLRISNPASVLIVGILYCLAILALIITIPMEFMEYSDDPVIMSAKLGDKIGLGIAIAILYVISCFGAVGSGLLVLRKTEPERRHPFRINISWVYFFILFSLAIFVGAFFPALDTKPRNFIERYYYIITYTIILFGLSCWYLIYYLPRRNSISTPPEMSNVVIG